MVKDGVIARPYFEADGDRQTYRSVPLPLGISLAAAVRQADFLGEKAFGVVATGQGFGVRVKSETFEDILKQVRPDDHKQFLGKKYEISGLPMAMGKESLTSFLGGWEIQPLYTFRQGLRRTWVVRAMTEPVETAIPHDYGLAVINDSSARPAPRAVERMRVPQAKSFPPMAQRFEKSQMHAPKSWAGVVAGNVQPSPAIPKFGGDGSIGAAAASRTEPGPAEAVSPTAGQQVPVASTTVPPSLVPANSPR